jgi:hypothetical protein
MLMACTSDMTQENWANLSTYKNVIILTEKAGFILQFTYHFNNTEKKLSVEAPMRQTVCNHTQGFCMLPIWQPIQSMHIKHDSI